MGFFLSFKVSRISSILDGSSIFLETSIIALYLCFSILLVKKKITNIIPIGNNMPANGINNAIVSSLTTPVYSCDTSHHEM